MATFWVTGIWKEKDDSISHIFVHPLAQHGFATGRKTPVADAIRLVEGGHQLMTLRWDYGSVTWIPGAAIEIFQLEGRKFLRTVSNADSSDSLGNLLVMTFAVF